MSKEEIREIKASRNYGRVVGTLLEKNLKLVDDYEVTLNNGKKVRCRAIVKAESRHPSLTIDVNGEPVGINYFPTTEITKDNESNNKFKSMFTVLEKYIDKTRATEEVPATRITAGCKLGLSEYANDKGDFNSFPQLMEKFLPSSEKVPEEDMCEIELTGIVRSITEEIKGEDGDLTGRLLVKFFTFDYTGALKPFDLVVEEDLADSFRDTYEIGCNCKLYIETVTKTVGAVKVKKTGGMGGRESKIAMGYSKTEYVIFNGDPAFEEDDNTPSGDTTREKVIITLGDLYVSMEDVKKAMAERDIFIKGEKQKKKDNPKKGATATKSKGLANKPSSIKKDEEPIEDDPFA